MSLSRWCKQYKTRWKSMTLNPRVTDHQYDFVYKNHNCYWSNDYIGRKWHDTMYVIIHCSSYCWRFRFIFKKTSTCLDPSSWVSNVSKAHIYTVCAWRSAWYDLIFEIYERPRCDKNCVFSTYIQGGWPRDSNSDCGWFMNPYFLHSTTNIIEREI